MAPTNKDSKHSDSSQSSRGTRRRGNKTAAPKPLAQLLASEPKAVRRRRHAPLHFSDPILERVVFNKQKLVKRVESIAKSVHFSVALQTRSRERLQDTRGQLQGRNLDDLRPTPEAFDRSEERLKRLGFTILRRGRFALSVSGPVELLAEITKSTFVVASKPRLPVLRSTRLFAEAPLDPLPADLYVAPAESLTLAMKGIVAETVDDFVFIPPPLFFAPPTVALPTVAPPSLAYHTLGLNEIAQVLNVPPNASAQGIRVAVIDTGFADHPYYQHQGFQVTTPGLNPRSDSNGHGTAVTANVFAVARDADVFVFQQSDPPQDALEIAVDNGARILSCSWGWDHEQSFPILEATLRDLITEGVVVLFASGNGQHAWPSTMPEVLSIGGVYRDAHAQLEASSYASGFVSSLYPHPPRRVPDVSGLCGQSPRGIYIPMPCHPGCDMDQEYGGMSFPQNDETGKNDGWIVASGTSSAAPQVAGVVALLLREAEAQGKELSPATVKTLLEQTAQAVTRGRNAFGFPATAQPNTACGWGLVDAAAALAKIASLP